MLTKTFYIFLLLFSFNSNAEQKSKLVLPKILSNGEVVLGESIERELKKVNADFLIYKLTDFSRSSIDNSKGHPMAVTADFNKDGYRDISFFGFSKNQKTSIIYVAISNLKKRNFQIHEVLSLKVNGSISEKLSSYLTQTVFKIGDVKREVFLMETFEPGLVSSITYYYSFKEKKVVPYLDKLD